MIRGGGDERDNFFFLNGGLGVLRKLVSKNHFFSGGGGRGAIIYIYIFGGEFIANLMADLYMLCIGLFKISELGCTRVAQT